MGWTSFQRWVFAATPVWASRRWQVTTAGGAEPQVVGPGKPFLWPVPQNPGMDPRSWLLVEEYTCFLPLVDVLGSWKNSFDHLTSMNIPLRYLIKRSSGKSGGESLA